MCFPRKDAERVSEADRMVREQGSRAASRHGDAQSGTRTGESQKRLDAVLNQLNDKREHPLDSPAIRALIGEYEAVMKKLHQLGSAEGLKQLMLSVASTYRHELVQSKTDEPYGEGASEFSAQAIEAFYRPA